MADNTSRSPTPDSPVAVPHWQQRREARQFQDDFTAAVWHALQLLQEWSTWVRAIRSLLRLVYRVRLVIVIGIVALSLGYLFDGLVANTYHVCKAFPGLSIVSYAASKAPIPYLRLPDVCAAARRSRLQQANYVIKELEPAFSNIAKASAIPAGAIVGDAFGNDLERNTMDLQAHLRAAFVSSSINGPIFEDPSRLSQRAGAIAELAYQFNEHKYFFSAAVDDLQYEMTLKMKRLSRMSERARHKYADQSLLRTIISEVAWQIWPRLYEGSDIYRLLASYADLLPSSIADLRSLDEQTVTLQSLLGDIHSELLRMQRDLQDEKIRWDEICLPHYTTVISEWWFPWVKTKAAPLTKTLSHVTKPQARSLPQYCYIPPAQYLPVVEELIAGTNRIVEHVVGVRTTFHSVNIALAHFSSTLRRNSLLAVAQTQQIGNEREVSLWQRLANSYQQGRPVRGSVPLDIFCEKVMLLQQVLERDVRQNVQGFKRPKSSMKGERYSWDKK